jgi:hypothetical protein
MKINKVIVGLGVVSLMLTSCDKAAEQDYTPAAGVATPPAYFSLDYDSEVVLEEEQTSFEFTIYRANGNGEQTTSVDVTLTSDDKTAGLFTFGDGKTAVNGQTVATNVTFEDGRTSTTLVVNYPWETMQNLPGVEFDFNLKVAGEDTEYFLTSTDYNAMYVPWLAPDADPSTGDATCYFYDDLIYSGWTLTGYPTPFKYEVDLQYNPIALEKGQLIYRVITPYANLGHYGSSDSMFVFTGYDDNGDIIKNVMYINATDPDNVYLCNRDGSPKSDMYNTYYTISPTYGNVAYFDRCASYLNDESYIEYDGSGYYNSQGDVTLNGYYNEDLKKIVFPEDHFLVAMTGYSGAVTYGDKLEIWLPGAKEDVEWEELGNAIFTDNIVDYMADLGEENSYEVPIEQNIKDPNLYRLINPFTDNCPYGDPQDDDYNIEFDVTNPKLVYVSLGETGYTLPVTIGGRTDYENYLLNAATLYTKYVSEAYQMTESEIIAQGMNDTFADNVITLANPALWYVDDAGSNVDVLLLKDDMNAPATTVVLPTKSGAPCYASAAVKNRGKFHSRASQLKATKAPFKTVKKVK